MGKILLYESYFRMIKNSIDTKMFRNLYLDKSGKKVDIIENGNIACAYFVSNLMLIWGLISSGHATIKGAIRDMERNGWKKVCLNGIKQGDVIVWEEIRGFERRIRSHIGFYIGNKKAISNDDKKGMIKIHNWTYENKRRIIAIYTHPKLK